MKIPAVALFLWCLSLAGGCDTVSSSPSSGSKGQTDWGFYQILWNTEQFEAGIRKQLAALSGLPRYVLFFRDLNRERGFPAHIVDICGKYGLTPVISFEPAPWRHTKTYPGLEEIVQGKWDDYFTAYAEEAAQCTSDLLFRFGFEMNGNWFSWGHKPELFVAAWRRVHGIFTTHGAMNVKWFYCPNVAWGKQKHLNGTLTYYPGDEYVDVVGLDGYNFGDNYDRYHSWTSYEEIFQTSIQSLSAVPKPLIIGEIGVANDPDRKPRWLGSFLEKASRDSRVSGFIYYNYYPRRKGYPNWRLDSDSLSLKVFRDWVESNAE